MAPWSWRQDGIQKRLGKWIAFYSERRLKDWFIESWNHPISRIGSLFSPIQQVPNIGRKKRYTPKKPAKNGIFIGQCGLLKQTVDGIEELEIGYSLLPEHRKKGYASEAAKKCKSFAFEHKLSNTLISIIHVDNKPSQRVALNNGMAWDKTTTYKNNPVHIYRVFNK